MKVDNLREIALEQSLKLSEMKVKELEAALIEIKAICKKPMFRPVQNNLWNKLGEVLSVASGATKYLENSLDA